MIAFGCAITDPKQYERFAEPGIRLAAAAEPGTQVLPHQATSSIFRSYNVLLDEAAKLPDLEALVLVHQDAEIVDPEFLSKLRRTLDEYSDLGLVGCAGAIGVRSLAWWEGAVKWASFIHRYEELGGGDLRAFSWKKEDTPSFARTGEVDSIDGFVMCFLPWTVQNIRFDESLGRLHGYDFDYCMQVREAGKKVVVADFKVIHNHSLDLVSNPDSWVEVHIQLTEKWEHLLNGDPRGTDWKKRALRAEANAAVSRAEAVAANLKSDARALWYERQMDIMRQSIGWRITEPLRMANQVRRFLKEKRAEKQNLAEKMGRARR